MTLNVEQGRHGLWYVTSPDVKGLLVAGKNMSDALGQVEKIISDITVRAR